MKKLILLSLCCLFILAATAQDAALQRLENSPRHHEWVELEVGGKTLYNFVVYPEKAQSTPALIVIHENRGLTDWVRSFADQAAEAGYLAIAPDLLSGSSPEYDRTSAYPTSDDARTAIYALDPEWVTEALNTVQAYISRAPACNGKVAVAGFCWGGSQSFRMAANNQEIEAALVFYGTAPKEKEAFESITAPVYGFYGGDDQRVNATIPDTEAMMEAAGKTYEYVIYPGAGHAFMRRGVEADGGKANKKAMKKAWKRVKKILSSL
ncbi:MAG: dienelactone hydrolase family protein [Phaeodactylibacter sp.]|nr:dienelactone hydrolase family protein [Phaeodactylibacter sp.]